MDHSPLTTHHSLSGLKAAVVKVCRLLHSKNLVAATDGNVSVRLGEDRFLVTPNALGKGFVEEDDLLVIDGAGNRLEGPEHRRASSEWRMHKAIYEERPDAMAVVHGHPVWATVCSLSNISLLEPVLPEVFLTLGGIPTLPYATPSSAEGSMVIREPIRTHDAVILDRHGAIALGADVFAAYGKLEKLEHTAQIVATARLISGPPKGLDTSEKERLMEVGRALGIV